MILQNHLPATKLWRSWSTVAHRGMKVWLAENNPLADKKAGPGDLHLHANACPIRRGPSS